MQPIGTMPGVNRLSLGALLQVAQEAVQLTIPVLALFPCLEPHQRDDKASQALDENGLIPRAVRLLKAHFPQLGIMCDAALDPYTSHAHDGLLDPETGHILNDETVSLLCQQALIAAQSGCDIIAPSDMMDGRIGCIRHALDAQGLSKVCLCSYAVKYATSLYGPFRDALHANGLLRSDKKSYQMSPNQLYEPLREAFLDIQEGADMLIVKPSLFTFDILWRVKTEFGLPTIAYQVSGEYATIAAAIGHSIVDKETILEEYMLSVKRAGADAVVTYFAPDIARMVHKNIHKSQVETIICS